MAKEIKGPSKQTMQRVKRENALFSDSGNWNAASPHHLVSLVASCHEEVYGVVDFELEAPKTFGLAAILAKNLLSKRFNGNVQAMVEFIRWTWKREKAREQWRIENQKEGKRISFRLQFSDSLFSDFVLHLRRQGKPSPLDSQQGSTENDTSE